MERKVEAPAERGTVILAEEDVEARRELAWALRSVGFLVTEVQAPEQVLELLAQKAFDLVLCGERLVERSALSLLREVVEAGHPVSVILLTAAAAPLDLAIDAMRYGAVDLLIQPMESAELIARVDEGVRKGKRIRLLEEACLRVVKLAETAEALEVAFAANPPSGSRLRAATAADPLDNLDAALLARLSPREREVTRRLAHGSSIMQLASELELSPNTVRNHVKSIFSKLQVRSQVALLSKLVGGR